MNINSILDRINTVIRGRFSANGGAAWINWTSDVLDLVERECPGTGQHVSVMAYPMDSGFIPKPPSIVDMTGVRIGGQDLKLRKIDIGAWPELLPDTEPISKQSLTGRCRSADGMNVIILVDGFERDLIDSGFSCLSMNVQSITAGSAIGSLTTSINGASIDGYRIELEGEFRVINNSVYDSVSNSYTFDADSPDVSVPFTADVVGFSDGAFDGWSINIGNQQVTVYKSTWTKPVLGEQGWSVDVEFSGSLMMPCKPFAYKSVTFIKSNVEVSGYSSISRPTSLTDEFPLDNKYVALMAAGLEMKAQVTMDPSSTDAKNCSAIFQSFLVNYRIDQSQSRGRAAIRATNSNPRLGRKDRGW